MMRRNCPSTATYAIVAALVDHCSSSARLVQSHVNRWTASACVPLRPPFDPCHFLRSDPHIRGPRVLENLHDCVVPAFTGAVRGSHHPLALGHDAFFACDHSGDNSTGLDEVVCVRPSTASVTLTKVSRLLAENQVRGGDVVRDTVARDLARNCFDRFSNDRVLDLSSPASFVEYRSGRCGVVLQTAFKHLPHRRLHRSGDIITQQFQNLLTCPVSQVN